MMETIYTLSPISSYNHPCNLFDVFFYSLLLQLEISSRCYNQQPLVIQGAGAGNDTTAAGVLADILDIQDLFPWQ